MQSVIYSSMTIQSIPPLKLSIGISVLVDKDDSKPRSDWKLNEEWAWFIGNNRERLKLTTKPEPYSFQRTLNWLSHQVAPTLKVAIKLDEINQTQVVKDILDHAKLTDRHKQILKQQSVKEQDVITTKK